MKEIIDKISSYNIFNYLFPGVLYVIILRETTNYNLIQDNNFLGAVLYYFIGLVISRFGSLIVGKILQSKRLKFIKFADYTDYINACDKDNKIELFSEVNNTYRTLISLLCALLITAFYEQIAEWLKVSERTSYIMLIVALIIIFVFSYRKQTEFIAKRVASRNKKK